MRTVKTWLATIAVLLCSITANAVTYFDWTSTNHGKPNSTSSNIALNTGNNSGDSNAENIVASGTCGTNLIWELTNEGELTIEGTGEMDNYETISQSPWYSYKSAIKSVIINEGVTTVGDYAFSIYTNLINLSLPNTLKIIGKNAFDTCEKLTSLIIPEGCTTIGYGAFLYCSGLNTITLPNSLTSIGDYAFASCWNIESLFIPEKVEFIGELAFRATTKLNTIRVDSNNTTFDSRNDCNAIIETNTNKLRLGCSSTIIPNDIVIIGNGAFHSQNLSVTIPQSVKTVESWAFNGSSGQIKILCKTPPTIEHQNAFSSSTAEIHVPYGCLESYADEPWYTFRKNGKLKEFVPNIQSGTCGENLTYSLDLDYGELTISGTGEMRLYSTRPWEEHIESIISVIIENGVTSIQQKAFSDYPNLISVQIPNSMVSIGVVAFEWCTSLANINIPNSVTTIGLRAFQGCSNLSNINIPNSVTNIAQEAFYGCKSLTTIKIPNSVTSIAEGTFAECPKLVSVDIPNSVTSIGDRAFSHCRSLINVEMPNNVTSIGSNAFEFCYNLINLEIPNTVTSIGAWAFNQCTSLTNINIPNGITRINRDVFSGCESITNIKIPNSVTSIGHQAFDGCSGLTSVTIPNSVTSIESRAFDGCSGLTSVAIPNSVTSIGEGAFDGCTGLTSVTIGNSVESIGSFFLSSCYKLLDIYCYAENVPSIKSDAFNYWCKANTTLHVPTASLESYKSTYPWSSFSNIVALPPEISLIDGVEYENNTDEDMSQITYTRTLNNTEWNALYLPFEIPVSQLTDKYEVAYINAIHSYDEDDNGEIDRMSMEVIKLREGTLHANHPYLIKARTAAAKQMSITVENTTLHKAESRTLDCSSVYTKFEITGIYEKMTSAQLAGCYALSGGSWKNLSWGSSLNPFRLYLRVSSREGSPVKLSEAALARIGIHVQGEETATSVEERLMQKQHKADAVYDLSGRRVTSPKKGQTYIVNGKKRMY